MKLFSSVSKLRKSPRIYQANEHDIDVNHISHHAIWIVRALQHNSFSAYIVGGAVRDLLLAQVPKDIDIVTDATPRQIKNLFPRSIIIGKRFRLVLVNCGKRSNREVFEVSTFRASSSGNICKKTGRILRDNEFGTAREDMLRRDFTINALLYDPSSQQLIDHVGGFADIKRKKIESIGVARKRFTEDPLRCLRAVRLAAKLDFSFSSTIASSLAQSGKLLCNIPKMRLFDEFSKMIFTGNLVGIQDYLHTFNLQQYFLIKPRSVDMPYIKSVLHDTDQRFVHNHEISLSFLIACIFWPEVDASWRFNLNKNQSRQVALLNALESVGRKDLIIKKVFDIVKEMYVLRMRIEDVDSNSAKMKQLAKSRYFCRTMAMLRLQADFDPTAAQITNAWNKFSRSHAGLRVDSLAKRNAKTSRSYKSKSPKALAIAQAK